LNAAINGVLATNTRRHWIALFEAQGVPCSPIHDLGEAIAQPQVEALGIIQKVPGEAFTLTGLPLSIDGVRPRITAPAPALGSDPRGHPMKPC
jgi:formyl-CoA transferase